MKRKSITKIRPQEAGKPVLTLLSDRFTYHTREEWEDRIRSGKLLLNQQLTAPADIVAAGDILEYFIPDNLEPPVVPYFSIVFEDDVLLVVDKPANLPCHPAGRYFNHTLWALVKTQLNFPHLTLVNRIDRETSGIVLLAKTPKAAFRCQRQFENRQAYKRYIALVEGQFPSEKIEARGYLATDPESPVRKKLRFYPSTSFAKIPTGGKTCCTIFRKIKSWKGISKVEAIPQTGRPHQIRSTLLGLGYPVVGDKLYGVDDRLFLHFISHGLNKQERQRLRLPRQALHSAELHIRHPETGKSLQFKAPIPADMQKLMNA